MGQKRPSPLGVASGSPLAASRHWQGQPAPAAHHSCPADFLARCECFHL